MGSRSYKCIYYAKIWRLKKEIHKNGSHDVKASHSIHHKLINGQDDNVRKMVEMIREVSRKFIILILKTYIFIISQLDFILGFIS